MYIKQDFIKFNRYIAMDQILPGKLDMQYHKFMHVLLQLPMKLLFTEMQADLPESGGKYCVSVQREMSLGVVHNTLFVLQHTEQYYQHRMGMRSSSFIREVKRI